MINRKTYKQILEVLVVLASALLIGALSYEVIYGDKSNFSTWYLEIQFVVCLLFLATFFVELYESQKPHRYLVRNILFLLLSIPYLNIVVWVIPNVSRTTSMLASSVPIVRSLLALFIILRWVIRGNTARRLFFAYTLAVLLFTYVSALIFYDLEYGVNSELKSFGDALWWAWMGLSTAGAQIFPITTIGRTLGVILPVMGMMILPIFTGYVLSIDRERIVSHPSSNKSKTNSNPSEPE
ncbi:MAG: ion channel [Rikenellaceae bacterium]